MKAKLIITFRSLSDSSFLTRAEGIVAAITGNATFPPPWPAQIPALSQITQDLQTYVTAYNAAQSGDKMKIALRDSARTALTTDLQLLAPYLEMIAAYDRAKLMTTGYALRKEVTKTSAANPGVLTAPLDFKVTRGMLSGVIDIHARKLEGAGSYELQTTLADPTVETNWAYAGTFMRCSKIEVDGLKPGQPISVRLRGIGSHSPGVWTPVASVMVA